MSKKSHESFKIKINNFITYNAYIQPNFKQYIKKNINYIIHSFEIYNLIYPFGKIKCYGKSYRIFLKKKYLRCQLNMNHWTKLYLITMKLKKLKKNLYIFKFKEIKDFIIFKTQIRSFRFLNKYTKRGLRVKKIKFTKRYGKISQAFTKLH